MRSVVQIYLGPPVEGVATDGGEDSGPGGVAQLGERLPCTQEVIGSIPFTSTSIQTVTDWSCDLSMKRQSSAVSPVSLFFDNCIS